MKIIQNRLFLSFAAGFAVFIFIWAGSCASAQNQPGTNTAIPGEGYVCVQRSPHQKLWQEAVVSTNYEGLLRTNIHSYTEIATGICRLQDPQNGPDGPYIDSVEVIDPVADGAQASQCRYQVHFAASATSPGGVVNLITPDGKNLLSTVYGLGYCDMATGSNVVLTQTQDSTGSISSNTLTYANAFSNLTADITYTYKKAGLSQNIVLKQSRLLPPPLI